MLDDKELLVGSMLFILLYSLEDSSFKGKRCVKKINRSIKKELAIARTNNKNKYLDLVYEASDIMEEVKNELRKQGVFNNDILKPGTIVCYLRFKYTKVFKDLNIPEKESLELLNKFNITDWRSTKNTIQFIEGYMNKIGIKPNKELLSCS